MFLTLPRLWLSLRPQPPAPPPAEDTARDLPRHICADIGLPSDPAAAPDARTLALDWQQKF